jgi:hypothetical protein
LNFNPTDRNSSCRRGEADAKISDADNEIVMKTFSIVETPIPKAQRSGIGKLNNPAQRRV